MVSKATDEPQPPAYATLPPREEDITEACNKWARDYRNKRLRCTACDGGRRPGCGYCASTTIHIGFEPEYQKTFSCKRILRDRKEQPSWRAVLLFHNANVPLLMRDGLHWSPQNLVANEQTIRLDFKPSKGAQGQEKTNELVRHGLVRSFAPQWGWTFREDASSSWPHQRRYRLRDNGPYPRWTATLYVFAPKASTVIDFDIGSITPETTAWALAKDLEGRVVYDTRRRNGEWFNTVFPQKPLGGWWPWPKATDNLMVGIPTPRPSPTRLEENAVAPESSGGNTLPLPPHLATDVTPATSSEWKFFAALLLLTLVKFVLYLIRFVS